MRSTMKKKIKDSFVEVSTSGIELLFQEMVGLKYVVDGIELLPDSQGLHDWRLQMRTYLWIDVYGATNQSAHNYNN